MPLFDEDFLKRLEPLRLAVRRRTGTAREGDRPAARPGGPAQFHSHRPYAPGDDLRAVDWPLYARLGQLFIRERVKEEAVRLHLVVDGSASMEGAKHDFARRMAAAIGLVAGGEGGSATLWGAEPRDVALDSLLPALEALKPGRPVDALRRLRSVARPFAIVIGDFWEDLRPELAALLAAGGQLSLIRVLAREELAPTVRGMVRFTDRESGEGVERFVGDEELARYRELLAADEEGWRSWARKHETSFVRFAADDDLFQSVFVHLRGEGVIE